MMGTDRTSDTSDRGCVCGCGWVWVCVCVSE